MKFVMKEDCLFTRQTRKMYLCQTFHNATLLSHFKSHLLETVLANQRMVTNGSFGIDPPPEGLRGVNRLAHRGDKDGGLPSCKTTGGTHRTPTPTCTQTQQSSPP